MDGTDATIGTVGPQTPGAPGGMPRVDDMVAGLLLEERIGAGGMGVVFRAYDATVDRVVAVKVVTPRVAADPGFRVRLLQEAAAAERVRHPNVVRVHDVGVTPDDITYIVMHHVAGPNLARLVERDGPLPPRLAGRILGQVAGALDAVHRAGLLHRDVKPGNILWEPESGTAYLADFGLAAAMGDAGRTGSGGFTAGYAPPEQLRGEDLSPAADVYALACTFFHCVTGRPPFRGDPGEVRLGHLAGEPPRPADIAPHLPRGFDEVFARALMKDPARRFGSAGEFAANIRSLRRDVVFVGEGACPEGDALARRLAADGWDTGVADAGDAIGTEACLGVARTAGVVVTNATVPATAPQAAAVSAALKADPLLRVVVVLAGDAPRPNAPELGPLRGFGWFDVRDHAAGDQTAAFRGTVERIRPGASVTAGAVCPYPGLGGFSRDDARFFSGRDRELGRARDLLAAHRFVALVGASGSGKSSLLRAGVLPASAADGAAVVTPGPAPLDRLSVLDRHRHTFVAVDQFEELFTADIPPEVRAAFVHRLFAFRDDVPDGRIAIAVRADFMGRCAEFPALRDAISRSQLLLGPMGPEDLRRALEEPARAAGLQLAPGLAERVVEEAGSLTGALPLVSDLMRQVWERRQQDTLTMEALVHVGGVRGALGRRADAAYAEISPDDRPVAREVLLRLVTPGEGTADSRRRAAMPELLAGLDLTSARRVVDTLVAHRLLTVDRPDPDGDPSVDIVHEALITGWPRLREWVDARREELIQRSRLTASAERWAETGEDEAHLLRGSALAIAQELDPSPLPETARRLVEASTGAAERARVAERRRFRRTITGLSIGVVVTSVLAVVALSLYVRVKAEGERREAGQLRAESETERDRDPGESLRLAEAAYRLRNALDVAANLRAARGQPIPVTFGTDVRGARFDIALVGPGGLMVASEEGLFVRDGGGRRSVVSRAAYAGDVASVTDGRRVAIRADAPEISILSQGGRSRATRRITGLPRGVTQQVAASPSGAWLAVLLVETPRACAVRVPPPGGRWTAQCFGHVGNDAAQIAVSDRGALLVTTRDGSVVDPIAGRVLRAPVGEDTLAAAVPGSQACFLVAGSVTGRVAQFCGGRLSTFSVVIDDGDRLDAVAVARARHAEDGADILIAAGVRRRDGSPVVHVATARRYPFRILGRVATLPIHRRSGSVRSVAMAADGSRLAAVTAPGAISIWTRPFLRPSSHRVQVPSELAEQWRFHLRRSRGTVAIDGARRFSLDGRRLADPPSLPLARPTGQVKTAYAIRADIRAALAPAGTGRSSLLVFRDGRWSEVTELDMPPNAAAAFAVGDGGDVAIERPNGDLIVVRAGGARVEVRTEATSSEGPSRLFVSPTGTSVVGLTPDGRSLRWWSADGPGSLRRVGTGGRRIDHLAFLSDGSKIALLAGGEVLTAAVGTPLGNATSLRGDALPGVISITEEGDLALVRRPGSLSVIDLGAGSEVASLAASDGPPELTTPIDLIRGDGDEIVALVLAGREGHLSVERWRCECVLPLTGRPGPRSDQS